MIERPLTKPSEPRDLRDDVVRDAASVVTAITARSCARRPRLTADRGGVDVDAVLAEAGADAADHAGDVGVAEQRQVRIVDLEVEALAPGLEQVRAVQVAERRADDLHALVAVDERDADEVACSRGRWVSRALGDRDPALLRQGRRVDEVDLLLGAAGEDAGSTARVSRRVSRSAIRPRCSTSIAVDAVGQRRGDLAEPLRRAGRTGRAPPCPPR